MIEIFDKWPWGWQVSFSFFVVAAVCFTVFRIAEQIRLTLRGYAPKPEVMEEEDDDDKETIEREECAHKDNLTEYCVKEGRNCVTRAECEAEIASRSSCYIKPVGVHNPINTAIPLPVIDEIISKSKLRWIHCPRCDNKYEGNPSDSCPKCGKG